MREIKYAKLQGTNAFTPESGPLGDTLPPTNKTVDLKMFDMGDKLLLRMKWKGKPIEAFIPMTNVQIAVYAEPEETSE